jgi:hypothetical protein
MYYAEVMWWNEYEEEDVITHMFVSARNYEEAAQYINCAFDHIESMTIEEFDSEECHIVYIPKEVVQQVKEENLY